MFVSLGKKGRLSACLLLKLLLYIVSMYTDRSSCHGGGKSSNGLCLEGLLDIISGNSLSEKTIVVLGFVECLCFVGSCLGVLFK